MANSSTQFRHYLVGIERLVSINTEKASDRIAAYPAYQSTFSVFLEP